MRPSDVRPDFSTRIQKDVRNLLTYCKLSFRAIIPAENILAGAESVFSIQSIQSADNKNLKNIAHFLDRLQEGLNVKDKDGFKNLEIIGLDQDPACRAKSEFADNARYFLERLGCKFAYNYYSKLIIGLKREIENGIKMGIYSYKKDSKRRKSHEVGEKPQPHYRQPDNEQTRGFNNDPTPVENRYTPPDQTWGFNNDPTPVENIYTPPDHTRGFDNDPTPIQGFGKVDAQEIIEEIKIETNNCRTLLRTAIIDNSKQRKKMTASVIAALDKLGRKGVLEDIELIYKISSIERMWINAANQAIKSIFQRFDVQI